MMQLRKKIGFLLAGLSLVVVAGCGGGTGSSLSTSTSSGRASLAVYVTDGFSDQYKQVLATLYKIELTTDGTAFTTVFSDTAGRTLDLASLASTSELLATLTVPTGSYTQARITFGDHVTLVDKAGTSTSVAVDSSVGTQAGGQVALTVSTPARVLANQTNAVTVDFKLAEFQLVGNKLRPSISCGSGSGDHPGGNHTGHLMGTISNLTGTTSTSFTLTGEHGGTVTVNLSSTTTITSGQTGAAATLANGQNVIVAGAFDPTTNTITATSVTLNDFTTINHTEVSGAVASLGSTAGTFVLTVARAEDIQPTGGTITVVTNAGTVFRKGRDQTGTIADVTVGANVEVEGVFDTTTQTLTAKSVSLHSQDLH